MGGLDTDGAFCLFAGGFAFAGRLEAVVHGIADEMHQWLVQGFDEELVELRLFAP
jgi:hypothetical protein